MKWDGKKKAVTFSYDDGICQDRRLLEMFRYYRVKGTFNLNSGTLSYASTFQKSDVTVHHVNAVEARELYREQEVAVHGLTHADLTVCDAETAFNEIYTDRQNLERLFGRPIMGMAYAFGRTSDAVVEILKKCGIRYARLVERSGNFDLQSDLLRFRPTCHHGDKDVMDLIGRFLEEDDESPRLFYLWGHGYEFDETRSWGQMEKILDALAGRDDIFYGTNAETLL